MGSIFTLFTPLTHNGVLFGLFDYIVPITLYCAWSALAFLDLARGEGNARRAWRWSAAILLVPAAGAAAYLVLAASSLSRAIRLAVVAGGLGLMTAAFVLTWVRIN